MKITQDMVSAGSVVLSRAGRDRNRLMVVISREGEYIYMCDGDLRKIARPKKKKLKHVYPKPFFMEGVEERMEKGSLSDSDIRKFIADAVKKEG
ncbi:MAG: RNA-binding protein [Christensenellales bacterium]|jgi:ribosomal protein L14E/L6E/L27E